MQKSICLVNLQQKNNALKVSISSMNLISLWFLLMEDILKRCMLSNSLIINERKILNCQIKFPKWKCMLKYKISANNSWYSQDSSVVFAASIKNKCTQATLPHQKLKYRSFPLSQQFVIYGFWQLCINITLEHNTWAQGALALNIFVQYSITTEPKEKLLQSV